VALEPIFDAGPLITACKCIVGNKAVIDFLIPIVPITLPTAVYQEVVVAGSRYPDAAVARQRVDAGSIRVETPQFNPDLVADLAFYNLGKGETEAILLTAEKRARGADATLVVDDILAYVVCDRMKINKVLFLDFLVLLTREGLMAGEVVTDIVQSVRSRYPGPFVAHTLGMLAKR
jgi:predicted nucleic acid-binding protein